MAAADRWSESSRVRSIVARCFQYPSFCFGSYLSVLLDVYGVAGLVAGLADGFAVVGLDVDVPVPRAAGFAAPSFSAPAVAGSGAASGFFFRSSFVMTFGGSFLSPAALARSSSVFLATSASDCADKASGGGAINATSVAATRKRFIPDHQCGRPRDEAPDEIVCRADVDAQFLINCTVSSP